MSEEIVSQQFVASIIVHVAIVMERATAAREIDREREQTRVDCLDGEKLAQAMKCIGI